MNYNKFWVDLIMIIIIIASPFAFYLHLLAPIESHIWETSFFKIDVGKNYSVRNYLWIYSYKSLIIVMISIWFITCKNRWRLVLLIPLLFEIFKFMSFINEYFVFFEDFKLVYTLIGFIPYTLVLIIVSKRLNYFHSSLNFKTNLNNEIYLLMTKISFFRHRNLSEIHNKLNELKNKKNQMDKKVYLTRLIELRDSLKS